ncbi:tetratricopeptide repeat protein [Streptomyces sp. NBC_00445]|uniref:tetratricopeptide repeat protein n=1 Tax=Streptomyces sp. NBC_00445 TaxID=2975745 RepID=UPI002E23D045
MIRRTGRPTVWRWARTRRSTRPHGRSAIRHQQTELADRHGQAHTIHHMGVVRRMTGDWEISAALHDQARILYEELGDHHGQARALHELGAVRCLLEDHVAATSLLERAVLRYEELGDRRSQARAPWSRYGTPHGGGSCGRGDIS